MGGMKWNFKSSFPVIRDYGEKPIKITVTATTRNGQVLASRENKVSSSREADAFRNKAHLELKTLFDDAYIFANYGH